MLGNTSSDINIITLAFFSIFDKCLLVFFPFFFFSTYVTEFEINFSLSFLLLVYSFSRVYSITVFVLFFCLLFFFYPANLCLIGVFKPFTVEVIIDMLEVKAAILLCLFCLFPLLHCFIFFLLSFGSLKYFLEFHLLDIFVVFLSVRTLTSYSVHTGCSHNKNIQVWCISLPESVFHLFEWSEKNLVLFKSFYLLCSKILLSWI